MAILVTSSVKTFGIWEPYILTRPITDLAFDAYNKALGRPPLAFVDMRPFGPPMVIVRNHEIAEQIVKPFRSFPHSLPKMPSVYGHMIHVTGPASILPTHVSSLTFLESFNRILV